MSVPFRTTDEVPGWQIAGVPPALDQDFRLSRLRIHGSRTVVAEPVPNSHENGLVASRTCGLFDANEPPGGADSTLRPLAVGRPARVCMSFETTHVPLSLPCRLTVTAIRRTHGVVSRRAGRTVCRRPPRVSTSSVTPMLAPAPNQISHALLTIRNPPRTAEAPAARPQANAGGLSLGSKMLSNTTTPTLVYIAR